MGESFLTMGGGSRRQLVVFERDRSKARSSAEDG
jgi:hypothetical protein